MQRGINYNLHSKLHDLVLTSSHENVYLPSSEHGITPPDMEPKDAPRKTPLPHFQIATQTAINQRLKNRETGVISSIVCLEDRGLGSTTLAAHDAASLSAWLRRQYDDCDVIVSVVEPSAQAA